MSEKITEIKGGCHCGKTAFTIPIPSTKLPLEAWLCHCTSCRKVQGSVAPFYTEIPAPDKSLTSSLSFYKTSKNVYRYFCSKCGSHSFELDDLEGGERWLLSPGIVQREDVPLFEFTEHIFLEDTRDSGVSDWLVNLNGKTLKRWALYNEQSEELPLDWKSPKRKLTGRDKLRARCHCGGVDFHISRPLFDSPEFKKDFPDLKMLSDSMPRGREHWFIANDKQKWIAGFCTCRDCRLVNGMDVMSWTYVPTSLITLADGSPHRLEFGSLKCYQSSPEVVRRFCGRCGATVFYQSAARPNIVDVAVGLLESDAGARAEDWLEWRKDAISWQDAARDPKLAEELLRGCQAWHQRQTLA